MVLSAIEEFCSNTSVHGIRYFTEKKRHWIERYGKVNILFLLLSNKKNCRIFWILAFTLSMIVCNYSILNIYIKWGQRPVIVSFDDKTTSISAIPFPAITVCTTEKVNRKKANLDRLLDAMYSKNHSMLKNLTTKE